MSIQNRSPFLTYGVAVFSVAVALATRLLFWSIFGAEAPFLFFLAAVAVTAWCGGFGPGTVATLLSAPLVWYCFLLPRGQSRMFEPAHTVHLVFFVLIGALISWLTENLHESRRRSEAAEREARTLAAEADEGKRILDALMECIPEGIVVAHGPDLKKRMVSTYGQGLTGWSRAALEKIPLELHPEVWRLYHMDRHTPAGPGEFPMTRVTRLGETIRGEEWILRQADGTFLPVLCNASPIRDEQGSMIGAVTAWSDITELKKAHEEAHLRDEKLRVALVRKGISVFSQDDQLRYTWIYNSPDALPAEALLGRSDVEVFAAEEGRLLTGIKQKVMHTGVGERHVVDVTLAGERRNYDLVVEPVRNSEGKIGGILGSAEDITERRHMEEALRRAHAELEDRVVKRTAELAQANRHLELERNKLTNILGSMEDGVYIASQDYEIEYANSALEKQFGPIEGRKCYEYLYDGPDACPWSRKAGSFEGKSFKREWTSPRTGRIYDIFDTPIHNLSGTTSRLEILHDITDHKRAKEELARKHQQLESLWNINRKIDADFERSHDYLLAEIVAMSGSPYGFLGLVKEDESGLVVRSWTENEKRDWQMVQQPVELPFTREGIIGEAIQNERFLIINRNLRDAITAAVFPPDHVEIERLLLVPVRSKGRIFLLGAVANKQHEYTDEDGEQLHAFLSSALVAMEKKKAEKALKESKIQLQRLSSELLTAQEAERLRISRELHDELGQSLTLIKLRIGLIDMNLPVDQSQLREHCRSASECIDQVIENTRRLSRDLRPTALDTLGVTAALRRLAADSTKASSIEITMELDDIEGLFPPQSCILLYRVFQETLNNIMKHSSATQVTVSAKREKESVVFHVEDNGKGMNLEEVLAVSGKGDRGIGLAVMRERVRTLGSSLEIRSQKGSGTRLSFSVPIAGAGVQ